MTTPTLRPHRRAMGVLGRVLGAVGLLIATLSSGAAAATAPVNLGTAESFAVLAGAGVTNSGSTRVNGDLGTCPTPAITGFPPGEVVGEIHANDAVACGAQSDLTIAYNSAAGRAPTTTFPGPTDLGGRTLTSGVYKSPSSLAITGTLTLDAEGDPAAVFIFQAGSTLITAVNSAVVVLNGAQACNAFWQIGSSATLGVGSRFVGTVMALTSITANTNAVVNGRLLARNGAVTLDSNTITRPGCAAAPTTTTTATTTTTTSTSTTVVSPTTSTSTTVVSPTTSTSTTVVSPTTSTTVVSPTTVMSPTTSTTVVSPTTVMSPTTSTTVVSPTTVSSTTTTQPATTVLSPTTSTTVVSPTTTATSPTTIAVAPTTQTSSAPSNSIPAGPGPSAGVGVLNPTAAVPGQSVVISGGGFTPGAPLQVTLAGAPAAASNADARGGFAVTFVVPRSLGAGMHPVVVGGIGADGEQRRSTATLRVASGATALPRTGTALTIVAALGFLCLGAGQAMRVVARRPAAS